MAKQEKKSEYVTNAEEFLKKHGIEFKATFLFHGPHFEDDKDSRDVYEIILSREGKFYSMRFGNSIVNSGNYYKDDRSKGWGLNMVHYTDPGRVPYGAKINKRIPPTAYDALTCLTKYDPGTFEDFCGEFGYDTDSRKAEKSWRLTVDDWRKVKRFFSKEELDELQEIN